jgi:thiamine-phosphate pyrophosphorylase
MQIANVTRASRGLLYLVITEEYCAGRSALDVAEAAIAGGVDIIQMREKTKTAKELIALGKKMAGLCKKKGVIFIVNDDPLLAREIDADGAHLGQEDLKGFSAWQARRVLGPDKIIGVSTHSVEQFSAANEMDFDYIAFGPVFETKTKDYFIGTGGIEYVLKAAKKPVFFIGGINLFNINRVLDKGARNIALIRGIAEAEDIISRTKEFKGRIAAKNDK